MEYLGATFPWFNFPVLKEERNSQKSTEMGSHLAESSSTAALNLSHICSIHIGELLDNRRITWTLAGPGWFHSI